VQLNRKLGKHYVGLCRKEYASGGVVWVCVYVVYLDLFLVFVDQRRRKNLMGEVLTVGSVAVYEQGTACIEVEGDRVQ